MKLASPLTGWVTSLDEVPDPVFAGRMLGDGVAIDPTEGKLVAPAAGTIVTLNPSRHAVTIDLDGGIQLLIHIGVDTVALAGKGFTAHVAEGQRVAAGELLIEFDLDFLARHAKSLITPVIVTRGGAVTGTAAGLVERGAPLFDAEDEAASAVPETYRHRRRGPCACRSGTACMPARRRGSPRWRTISMRRSSCARRPERPRPRSARWRCSR